jgi:hypothetical protein
MFVVARPIWKFQISHGFRHCRKIVVLDDFGRQSPSTSFWPLSTTMQRRGCLDMAIWCNCRRHGLKDFLQEASWNNELNEIHMSEAALRNWSGWFRALLSSHDDTCSESRLCCSCYFSLACLKIFGGFSFGMTVILGTETMSILWHLKLRSRVIQPGNEPPQW